MTAPPGCRHNKKGEEAMIIDAIRKLLPRDNLTFAELMRLEGFAGDQELVLTAAATSNIVLWAGLSAEAADALKVLLEAGECHFRPTSPLTYLCDGMMLKYPLVKRSRHYKTAHWAPCVLKPGAPPGRARSLKP
jgi:hypothetical protein